jgi:dolichol-phosphate mannosyltransferase
MGALKEREQVKSLVIIPTYNERDNLTVLLSQVLSQDDELDVLIVDDNSPDGTGVLADELAAGQPRIKVLHRERKEGLGSAYVRGFEYALGVGYERVVQMDADFSHSPQDLPRLMERANSADLVIGSRNVSGGGVVGWPWSRNLISKSGSLYARLLLRLPIRDCTAGFKCFRRSALEVLDLGRLRSDGYGFQIEVNHACARAGMRLAEVPVTFKDRVLGKSKMSPGIVVEAAWLVFRLRVGLVSAAVAPQTLAEKAA